MAKKRFDTKRRAYAEQQRDERVAVQAWWRTAVVQQRIFVSSFPTEKVDYVGKLPWPDMVSLRALHHEFVANTGTSISRLAFGVKLREAMGKRRGDGNSRYQFHTYTQYDISHFRRDGLTRNSHRDRMGVLVTL